MRVYRCRALVSMERPPWLDAAFVIDEDRILEVGPAAEVLVRHRGPITDLGDMIVLPGLINAHCHLDYTLLRGTILPSRNFPAWIRRINALKRSLSDQDYLHAIELGQSMLRRTGTTTVFDIAATPQILPRLALPEIRIWSFLELIDVRPRPWVDAQAYGSWTCFAPSASPKQFYGLSPHAPYTASPALYELSRRCSEIYGLPVATHVAESTAEYEMFRHGTGDLYDFLANIGRSMDDCGGTSPLRTLAERRLIGPNTVLIHLNEVDDADWELLSQPQWRGLSVVHCPKSHRFLHHRTFAWSRLANLGVKVCLGTDSLASNDSLDLFSEMRMARRTQPDLSAEQILAAATIHPAGIVDPVKKLGRLAPGYNADAIAIPYAGVDIYETILENRAAVSWMMVDGRELN